MSTLAQKMFVLTSERMGGGDPALGQKMMRGFLKMLGKQPEKPNAIFFLGDSVNLVTQDSPVLEFLKVLEQEGVELLLCKAAIEWYALETQIAIGKIISTGIWLQKMSEYEVVTF